MKLRQKQDRKTVKKRFAAFGDYLDGRSLIVMWPVIFE
jgi:hypothetical protein